MRFYLKEILNRIILLGNVPTPCAFKKIGGCSTLESLIMADKEVLVSGNMGEGNAAMQWVMKHKLEEGLTSLSIGVYMPGVKSILSTEQALITLQGAV